MKKIVSTRNLYLFACIFCVVLWQIDFPEIRYVIYPLNLLATWSHEMGHGITALLLGGKFSHLYIYPNGNGVAYFYTSSNLSNAFSAAGGLLGPCIVGFMMVTSISSEKSANINLKLLALFLLLSVIFLVRNPSGIIVVLLLTVFVYLVSCMKGRWRIFMAQLISAQMILSPLQNWRYLFMNKAVINGHLIKSDVSQIAEYFILPLPYFVWGTIIASLTIFLFVLSLKKHKKIV